VCTCRQFGTVNIREDNTDETAESILQQYTQEEQEEIVAMRNTPNLYSRLAASLAPAVFGTRNPGRRATSAPPLTTTAWGGGRRP
jgi:DNA replicative helicase MCM subunit Mcm2 (Cdc46/Mcm family)